MQVPCIVRQNENAQGYALPKSNTPYVNRLSRGNSEFVVVENPSFFHVQRTSPLACLRLRELGTITDAVLSIGEEAGTISSFFGDGSNDCRELRPDVVRGNRLLVLMPEPLIPVARPLEVISSLLPIRNGIGPLNPLRCRASRSAK